MTKRIQENLKYKSKFGTLFDDTIKNASGEVGSYLRWKWSNSGIIIVPCKAGSLGLARMFRYPIENFSLEFPRGGINNAETLELAAKRELLEETGLIATQVTVIGQLFADTGLIETPVHVVTAEVTGKVKSNQEQFEHIKNLEWFEVESINNLVISGGINCALTIASFSLYILTN